MQDAWGKSVGADGKVLMLADGSANFAKVSRAGTMAHMNQLPYSSAAALPLLAGCIHLALQLVGRSAWPGGVTALGDGNPSQSGRGVMTPSDEIPCCLLLFCCCPQAIDAELDLSDKGLGVRSRRYAMLVDDGVVKVLNLEEGGAFTVSSAEDILAAL